MTKILQSIAESLIEKMKSAKTEEEFLKLQLFALYLDDYAIRRNIYLD